MPPVIISTFADLIELGFRLHGTCNGCGVNRDIDLTRCLRRRIFVRQRFKCRECGSSVMFTLSKIVTSNDQPGPGLDKWRER